MRTISWLGLSASLLVFTLVSRAGASPAAGPAPKASIAAKNADDKASDKKSDKDEDEAEIKANLNKLNAHDRKLAEKQKYCVVQDDERLGSMGVPVRILVKDQPVFLCCKGCKKKALANPDETLAKLKALKEKARKESQKQ